MHFHFLWLRLGINSLLIAVGGFSGFSLILGFNSFFHSLLVTTARFKFSLYFSTMQMFHE